MLGEYRTTQSVLRQCLKDLAFYKNSNGGISVTGGEPTSQFDALTEFLQMCKQYRLHTAMETCGYVKWRHLDELSDYLDLVFYDIKHMDMMKHKYYTGAPNDLILENAKKLSRKGVPIVITVPLIPGCNDDEENVQRTALFASGLESLKGMRLLPYHRLATHKYEGLGKRYPLDHVVPPEKEYVLKFKNLIESNGLKVTVGF